MKTLFIIILLILIAYLYVNLPVSYPEEHFTQATKDDDLYSKLYGTVFNDKNYLDYDCGNIIKRIDTEQTGDILLLDAGCGAAHHYSRFTKKYKTIGVDNSRAMIKHASIRVPEGEFIHGDLNNTQLFKENKFNHIACMADTIHHNNPEKVGEILSNFNFWLKKGGLLFIHLFNKESLDPAPRDFSQYYHDKEGNKHALTYFENFSHDAWWEATKHDDLYIYREKVIIESGNNDIRGNVFYIPDKDKLVSQIKGNGFKLIDIQEMKKIDVECFNLYVFRKV